jgi:hypothetical protein
LSSRTGNLLLNIALGAVLIVAVVLVYSFSERVSSPRPDPNRLENPGGLLGDVIQLEVRNAAGVEGLAGEMTQYLTDLGFDVVEMGNWNQGMLQETVILDRIGNRGAVEQVAMALGVDSTRIQEELKPTWFLDASILIGSDFRSIKPFSDRFPQEPEQDNEEPE